MIILDTTIRDGSYAINFNFSCAEVSTIASRLEKMGIEYIEIGHGMGLNASSPKNGVSLHSDIEYMDAARKALKKAKFGFFCIPGIASLEDLDIAKDHGPLLYASAAMQIRLNGHGNILSMQKNLE